MKLGFNVRTLYPSPRSPSAGAARALASGRAVRTLKRRFIPMPMRRGNASNAVLRQLKEPPRANLIVSMAPTLFGAAVDGQPDFLWLDVMDVWSRFAAKEATVRSGVARFSSKAQARLLARRERMEYQQATILTAAGKQDEGFIGTVIGQGRVTWLPTPVIDNPRVSSRRGGKVAGMLANFDYWPNRDAFGQLIQWWLPALAKDGWEVVVAGHGSWSLPLNAGIRCIGPVQDLEDFYSAIDVSLAPVRLGGGMKVKVVESLCYGVPVLCAPEALEGLPADILPGVIVASELTGKALADVESRRNADISSGLRPYTNGFFYETVECLCRAKGLV